MDTGLPLSSVGRFPPRVTYVENLYFQSSEEEPVVVSSTYQRVLQTESVLSRRKTVTTDWSPLELLSGVQEGVHLLHIKNISSFNLTVIPTPEQENDLESRVLELGMEIQGEIYPLGIYIPVNGSIKIHPDNPSKFRIRSRVREAKYLLTIIEN